MANYSKGEDSLLHQRAHVSIHEKLNSAKMIL